MLKEIRASLSLPDVLFSVDQHTSHWIAPNPDRFPYRKFLTSLTRHPSSSSILEGLKLHVDDSHTRNPCCSLSQSIFYHLLNTCHGRAGKDQPFRGQCIDFQEGNFHKAIGFRASNSW
jgi:hypothetical protein